MPKSLSKSAIIVVLSSLPLALVTNGCATDLEDETAESDDALNISRDAKIGDIAFEQTKDVAYTKTPAYRALRVSANAGDVIDAWVRGPAGLDAKAWVLDSSHRTLATNDDADATTKDAHVTFTVARAGTYYVALREKSGQPGTFKVSLGPRQPTGVAALPDGTYRIPTKATREWGSQECGELADLYTVKKQGDTLEVRAYNPITYWDVPSIVATGSASSGEFVGSTTFDPDRLRQGDEKTFTMRGKLTFENGTLALRSSYEGPLDVKSWSGSIATTLFGQDVLPPGVQRATVQLSRNGGSSSNCHTLDSVTFLRTADGKKLVSLPEYHGDVPVDARTWQRFGCARRGAHVSLYESGTKVHVYQGRVSSSGGCSHSGGVPDWFQAP